MQQSTSPLAGPLADKADLPAGLSRHLARLLDPVCVLTVCLGLALATRAFGMTTTVTADEGYWMQRTVRFAAALARGDLDATFRSGHPGVSVIWVGALGIGPSRLAQFIPDEYVQYPVLERAPFYLESFGAARYAMVLANAAIAAGIVGLAWKLLGAGAGLAGGLVFLLDPYLIGMSRLLHVDALLAPLMALSALAALVYWTRERRWPYLLLSGVAAGLALLTKAPAAYLIMFVGLVGMVTTRGRWRQMLPLGLWALVIASVYVALWPTLWVNPVGRLIHVAQFALFMGLNPHASPNFFLGQPMTTDPGPLYYPVTLAFRLGPVAIVGLLGLLVGLLRREGRGTAVLWLIAYAVLFIGLMTLGSKKFDRYMLPALIVLDILAGVGLWNVLKGLRRPGPALAVGVGLLLLQSVLLWRAYPYLVASYNPLVGGAEAAQRAILVGWGEGLDQLPSYFNAQPDADRLVIASNYDHVIRPRVRGQVIPMAAYMRAAPDDPRLPMPNYFVIYTSSAQRRQIPDVARQAIQGRPPELTAMVNGVPYAWVYRGSPVVVDQQPVTPTEQDEEEDGVRPEPPPR
jgi:hypothetical protein